MRPRSVTVANHRTRLDLTTFAERCEQAADPDRLAQFAHTLGVSLASLQRLRLGWATVDELDRVNTACRGAGRWTFPMLDIGGRVIGMRLRTPSGAKYSIKGGQQGLFIPQDIDAGDALLICEGPTDSAAMLDLGFDAIGRPSCTGGVRLVVDFVKQHRPARVVVVADLDEPGVRGATALASRVRVHCHDVRIITPPKGVKDARAWLRAGATRLDAIHSIDSAVPLQLNVVLRGEQ